MSATLSIDAQEYLAMQAVQSRLPIGAPGFLCPYCDCPLRYEGSHSDADSDRPIDQSDRYMCPAGCGTYEYVRQTHRMHVVQ